ncbi:MAG TPA: hypothetical protein VG146_16405 [Verrucomicrobiae bacterium]|nr:hypothetical protein [Verrucomicrobiae bacterium]
MTEGLAADLKIEGAKFPVAMDQLLEARLSGIQLTALIAGLVALGATAYGAFSDRSQFFFSYLFGYLFWLGLSLGCFLVTMIHTLTGGRWGYPARRFLEAGFMVLPLMLVLFVPIFFGLHTLYPWARPEQVAVEKVLRQRHVYENWWAYIARTVFFLGVWICMSQLLRRWSLQQDATTDAAPTRRARILSGPGIVIYGLLGTFACVDWVMSLEIHWYSTMFAVIIIIGQILVAYAFSVLLLTLCSPYAPLSQVVNKSQYHQLGNLLLAFVMFWTYVSFGQLLIVYSGDKPDELDWYLHRIAGNWKLIVVALGLFHFFLPFYLLLFRAVKKHVVPITSLAAVLFLAHIVAIYWLVVPAFHQGGLEISWLDFTAPIGIGGLWIAFFISRLRAAPLLPQRDPGLQFAFKYGH